MKKILLFVVSIIFIGCLSNRTKLINSTEIDNAIYDKLLHTDVIIWNKSQTFIELDFSKIVVIDSILESRLTDNKDYLGYYSVINFKYKNGNDIIKHFYRTVKVNRNENISKKFLFGKYKFTDDFILSDFSENNEMQTLLYNNLDEKGLESNYYAKISTIRPANDDYILVVDENLINIFAKISDWNFNNQRREQEKNELKENANKLIALLVNPMAADKMGQFVKGERVYISRALIRAVDLQRNNGIHNYLVMINDMNVNKPFYIISNRTLNIMDLSYYRNTIFEDLIIQYVGEEEYLSNGIPRETFVFQLLY